MGESEVPAYLQDETTGPATVVPATPAATTGEQVDEFGYAYCVSCMSAHLQILIPVWRWCASCTIRLPIATPTPAAAS